MKSRPVITVSAVLTGAVLATMLCGCNGRRQSPPPAEPPYKMITSSDLFGVSSVDQSNAWVVGFNSAIFHTSDRGQSWRPQPSGVTYHLCDAAFASVREGWICGRSGTMLHTADGGATWTGQTSGTRHHLFALWFHDDKNGWAVGNFGTIIHTADGGRTWTDQSLGEDRIYNDVCFADALNGWVVGEYGLIYHTSDGGRTWARQECDDIMPVVDETTWDVFPPSLYGVFCSDARTCWAVGMDGIIIQTSDGGTTWKKVTSPAEESKVTLYKIQVINKTGWVAGQRGTCLLSRDGGRTWEQQSGLTNTKFWLRDLSFCDSSNGFAVGARGTIITTTDGGGSWTMISGIPLVRQASQPGHDAGTLQQRAP